MSSSESAPAEPESQTAGGQQHGQHGQQHADKKDKKVKKDKATRMKEKEAELAQQAARNAVRIEHGGLNEKDGSHGDLSLVCSVYEDQRAWLEVGQCGAESASRGGSVWIRARLSTIRAKGKTAFVVLRAGLSSVQAVVADGAYGWDKEGIKWLGKVAAESIVDVYGDVVRVEQPTHTSQSDVEVKVRRLFVVSLASPHLPFQLSDAARPAAGAGAGSAEQSAPQAGKAAEEQQPAAAPAAAEAAAAAAEGDAEKKEGGGGGGGGLVEDSNGVISVGQDLRLDNRWIDLRTPANHAIFRLQSRVCQYYRQFFYERDFIEIHTPKLTPGVSEGGAAVFRLKYFEQDACLAQSPQLYKQMAVASDLRRVFEIGPVFRAEYSNTHRHMCEFTGLDFEMEIKQHYHEVLAVLGDLLVFIFDNINAHCQAELHTVAQQYPFKPLRYNKETLILPFPNAVSMLQQAGEEIGPEDDFTTPQEKRLGRLVSERYGVDFYIVDQYPLTARPFYTMPSPANPRFTNSYDVFVRGEEITSGAQRIHDVELLQRRAEECGIPPAGITSYLESFKFGMWPHGGAGIGLERVVMLFLGLDNIRKSALFPRTPNRCTP